MTTESNNNPPSRMDAESEKPESASPTPRSEQSIPHLEQAAAKPSPVQAEKPGMGRFQRILRNTLIALAAVALIFLAGYLTNHFTVFSPMKTGLTAQLTQTQDELTQANQTTSELRSQINTLTAQLKTGNDRIATLEDDKENLQSDLEHANAHIELLMVQVELKTAHIELQNQNLAGAKVALSGTAARLEILKPVVETVDTNLAANMLTRLKLVLEGMDSNPATAQADLEQLAKNLQSVEALLFDKK